MFVHPLPAEEENRAYCDLIHTTEYLEESRDWFQVLARCHERTPLLDSFLTKRDLGHEFLLIARKPRVPSKDGASQHQPDQAEEEGDENALSFPLERHIT